MTCPRCGFDQPQRADCARCGIVVARYRSPATAATANVARAVRAPPEHTRGPRRVVAWAVGAAGVVAVLALLARRTPPPAVRPAEAQAAAAAVSIPEPAWEAPSPVAAAAASGPIAAPTPEAIPEAACPLDAVAAGTAPRLSVSREWLRGADGHSRAQDEQRESGAPMLVYFYTNWCGYCRRLDETLLAAWDVERYLGEHIVKVRINPEESGTDRQLSRGYAVTGYPTLFLVNESGRRSFSPYARDASGGWELMTPGQFVAALDEDVTRQATRLVSEAGQRRAAGDAAAALSLLDRALALRPADVGAWLQRGIARETAGDIDAALGDLRQARDLDAGQVGVYEATEFVLGKKGRWAEAASCWNAYIDREPRAARAYFRRGGSYFRAGDRRRALSDAESACTLGDPQGCDILKRLKG